MIASDEALGWFVLVFGGAIVVVSIIQFIKPGQLVIDDHGFALHAYPFHPRGRLYRWEDIAEFRVEAGGRGSPYIAFDTTAGATPVRLGDYGVSAFELEDLLTERRRAVLGEPGTVSSRLREVSAADLPAVGSSMTGPDTHFMSVYFEGSADSRRPPATGSYVLIARTLASANRIARRSGERLIDGVVDGEQATACVVLVGDVGPVVFLDDRVGSRVLAPALSDHDEALWFARFFARGPVRRAKKRS